MAKLHELKILTLRNSLKGQATKGSRFTAFPRASRSSVAYLSPSNSKTFSSFSPFKTPLPAQSVGSKTSVGEANNGSTGNSTSNTPTYKKLSAAELRARREKGLCY